MKRRTSFFLTLVCGLAAVAATLHRSRATRTGRAQPDNQADNQADNQTDDEPEPAGPPIAAVNTRRIEDHILLTRSVETFSPSAPQLFAAFAADMRTVYPSTLARIPTSPSELMKALFKLAFHYDQAELMVPTLQQLGRAHAKTGVRLSDYTAVAAAMLDAVSRFSGPEWTPEFEGAWQRLLMFASATMALASLEDFPEPGSAPSQVECRQPEPAPVPSPPENVEG